MISVVHCRQSAGRFDPPFNWIESFNYILIGAARKIYQAADNNSLMIITGYGGIPGH